MLSFSDLGSADPCTRALSWWLILTFVELPAKRLGNRSLGGVLRVCRSESYEGVVLHVQQPSPVVSSKLR